MDSRWHNACVNLGAPTLTWEFRRAPLDRGGAAVVNSEDIYGKVRSVLVEALNVDEDDITPKATLQADLGAESIDFLDIAFRLEREFGIKMPRGELFPDSIFQDDPDFVRDGQVTDLGMAELRAHALRRLAGLRPRPPVDHGV
jgi:acyl carrier protein